MCDGGEPLDFVFVRSVGFIVNVRLTLRRRRRLDGLGPNVKVIQIGAQSTYQTKICVSIGRSILESN